MPWSSPGSAGSIDNRIRRSILRRMASTIWVGTRKGLWALRSDAARRRWTLAGPQFLGHIIHHVVQDPREPRVLLMAAKTGHLGPTVFRSTDRGRRWQEAEQPPAFRKALEGETPKAVMRCSGSPPVTRASAAGGTRERPRRDCSAARTRDERGGRWRDSTTTRCCPCG